MQISGYSKLTLQDYPGHIAAICFTSGCQLRCPYCHNAGLVLMPQPNSIPEKGNSSSLEQEFMTYLEKRKFQLEGVVISGGEPMMQDDLEVFIKKIKRMGLLVKIDTNGLMPERLSRLVNQGLIDYVAMDYKNCRLHYAETVGLNGSKHEREFAKRAYNKWLLSLEILRNSNIAYELRTTITRELHSLHSLLLMAEELSRECESDELWYLQSFVRTSPIIADYDSKSDLVLTAYSDAEMAELMNLLKNNSVNIRLRSEQIA